jgi:hypothetical protein
VQQTVINRMSQRIETLLAPTVLFVFDNDQWIIEEYVLGFRRAYIVLVRTLAAVAVVPFKSGYPAEIDHFCILL